MRYTSNRYSRLQRLEEKRNVRKATMLTLGGIVILALVLLIGIPLLVKLLMFMGDIRSADQPINQNDSIPPGPPQLFVPYNATNSATQTIKGLAEPGASVYLTINSDSIGNVVVADNGEFVFTGINLFEGTNQLITVAIDPAGNKSQPSQPVNIVFSSEAPSLEIQSPTDRQNFSGNPARLDIIGKTDPGVHMTVNGRVIIVDSAGNFASTYNLNSGENTLVISAVNQSGNITRKELLVTYTP